MSTSLNQRESNDTARQTHAVREDLQRRRAPNLPLLDQHGQTRYFYDDVLKNRRVLLSVMYTGCSNICTPVTRNLIEAHRLLGEQARDLQFVAMTLTPLDDSPAVLRAYMKQHGIDSRWTYLTGQLTHVDRLQRALGLINPRNGDDLLSHSAAALYCDERNLRWSHVNALLSPQAIARMVRFEMV